MLIVMAYEEERNESAYEDAPLLTKSGAVELKKIGHSSGAIDRWMQSLNRGFERFARMQAGCSDFSKLDSIDHLAPPNRFPIICPPPQEERIEGEIIICQFFFEKGTACFSSSIATH